MYKSKSLPRVQVPAGLSEQPLRAQVETNIRLITAPPGGVLACRRLEVRSAAESDDLRQKVCSRLRRRDHLVTAPSHLHPCEILVVGLDNVAPHNVDGEGWEADLHDSGQVSQLRFEAPEDQCVIAILLQRCVAMGFEGSPEYWRLGASTRFWHERAPARCVDGIEMIPRLSFATLPLGERGIGLAFDFGHLFRTERTVADFFDTRLNKHERAARRRRFDQLRSRRAGRKGNLLYDLRKDLLTQCYFQRFADDVSCEATGPFKVGGQSFGSLYEYYGRRYPALGILPSDAVAYVSFPNLPHDVPVAAKLLRLRVMLDKDQMPVGLRQMITMPAEERRSKTVRIWRDRCKESLTSTGCRFSPILWRPGSSEHERLPCPELQFGRGRIVAPPAYPSLKEYKQYYRGRLNALRNGGLHRYDEAVPRELHLVTPPASAQWPDKLQDAFVQDFAESIGNITGRPFQTTIVRAGECECIIDRLSEYEPATAVIVFDDRIADGSVYALLAHHLKDWRIKRLTQRAVTKAWERRTQARGADQQKKADRNWRDMITHSVLKTLDRMGAILWRLGDWPYEACLTIDVGEGRRFFAISLLICRDITSRPSVWRITRAWPKGDHHHESINPEILRDKIVELWEGYRGSSFSPLRSLLVLRDGHECGEELTAINAAIDGWQKSDHLAQGAVVDIVEVHKKTTRGLRIWDSGRDGACNAVEGQAVHLDDRSSLVACTGAATLPRTATAEPCMLVGIDGADLRRATRAFFALAQLNFSSPGKAHRYAQPLRETDLHLKDRLAREMRGIR